MNDTREPIFTGSGVAIITPFKEDVRRGTMVDIDCLQMNIDRQIDAGTQSIILAGTTGENPTLRRRYREEIRMLDAAVEVVDGRVPIIMGTGSNSTEEAVEQTIDAQEHGATAAMVVNPYYNDPEADGLVEHFAEVDAVGLPIVLYNVPSRTGTKNFNMDVLRRIAERCANLDSIKEATSPEQMAETLRVAKELGLGFYSGNDDMNYWAATHGGTGFISVTANAYPTEVQMLWELVQSGEIGNAELMHENLAGVNDAMFREKNPIPVKGAMAHLELCEEIYRLPMTPMRPETREVLLREMQKFDNNLFRQRMVAERQQN